MCGFWLCVMGVGMGGSDSAGPTFQVAWTRGSNVLIQPLTGA